MLAQRLAAVVAVSSACALFVEPAGAVAPTFSSGTTLTFPSGTANVFAGALPDLNADGKPDFVTANFDSNDITVFKGNGDGTFTTPAANIATDGGANYVTVGNFNGDSKADLAIPNFTGNDVSILLNTTATTGGTPTFTSPAEFPTGGLSRWSATADFDADGKMDLAVPKLTSTAVGVLLGNGAGSFGAATDFTTSSYPEQAAVGLFNADAKPDIVTANYFGGNVTVLLNTTTVVGTPTFSTTTISTGFNTRSVAVVDLNHDGKVDVVATNETNPGKVYVLLSKGDGTFQTPVPYTLTGNGASNVNYGDFNGDGNVDLVTANDGTSSTDVLLGVGDGTFAPSQSFVLPSANVTVSVADINVDGKPDLVFNSGEILLNTTPTPTPPPPPPGGLSPPVIQKTSNVKPVSGSVRIKRPGSNAFVNLTGAAQIPLGSTIDASKGRVTTAIARKGGGTDAADFYEGQFVVSQDATGLATLTMDGGSFKSCKKKKVKHALHSAKKRRSIRHLWGSGVGRFRTRGRHSSATVRGTIWDVEDRCDGTLTKVVKGTVSVRDFKKKKTVTVKAGKSYLARK